MNDSCYACEKIEKTHILCIMFTLPVYDWSIRCKFFGTRMFSCMGGHLLTFIYSEKATKFWEIFPLLLTTKLQSKVRGRFRKILWPSQDIWTLGIKVSNPPSEMISTQLWKTSSNARPTQLNFKLSWITFRWMRFLPLLHCRFYIRNDVISCVKNYRCS